MSATDLALADAHVERPAAAAFGVQARKMHSGHRKRGTVGTAPATGYIVAFVAASEFSTDDYVAAVTGVTSPDPGQGVRWFWRRGRPREATLIAEPAPQT